MLNQRVNTQAQYEEANNFLCIIKTLASFFPTTSRWIYFVVRSGTR